MAEINENSGTIPVAAPASEVAANPQDAVPENTPKPNEAEAAKTGDMPSETPTDKSGEENAENTKKVSPGVQRRFHELTEARKKTQEDLARANRRIQELEEQAAQSKTATAAEDIKAPVFETPEQYQKDMAEYTAKLSQQKAEQAVFAQQQQAAINRQRELVEKQAKELNDEYQKRVKEAVEETPDFFEKVDKLDAMQINYRTASAIKSLENGPQVAYYLGQNLDFAQNLLNLPADMQIVEIGRLASSLEVNRVKTSAAPPPINPVRQSTGSTQAKAPTDMSMDEYARFRQEQLRNR